MTRTKGPATGYHVEVSPGCTLFPRHSRLEYAVKDERVQCETMVDQIKRHVDDVGSVSVVEEQEDEWVCSFCGYPWSEADDSPHNGGCCAKDNDVLEQAETNGSPT